MRVFDGVALLKYVATGAMADPASGGIEVIAADGIPPVVPGIGGKCESEAWEGEGTWTESCELLGIWLAGWIGRSI